MQTYGSILADIQQLIDDDSTETATDICRHVNNAYRRIGEQHNWTTLTKQITGLTTTLPGDLIRLIYVEDDTDYIYFNINFQERYSSNKLYNYFQNMTVTTPLLTGTDGVVTANSTTVTSATGGFTAAMVNEYIRIGVNGGVYKITARNSTNSITIDTGYRGASDTAQYFEVRPMGTLQVAFSDQDGTAITSSSSMKIWYLARPVPLYNTYDPILLPGDCEPVRIMAMRLMLESQKYVNDSLKALPDFTEAMTVMRSLDQATGQYMRPRHRNGTPVAFGRMRNANLRYSRNGQIYL